MAKKQLVNYKLTDARGNELAAIPYREAKLVNVFLTTADGVPISNKVVCLTIDTKHSPNACFLTAGRHPELSVLPISNKNGRVSFHPGFHHHDHRETFSFSLKIMKGLGEEDEQFRQTRIRLKIVRKPVEDGEDTMDPTTAPPLTWRPETFPELVSKLGDVPVQKGTTKIPPSIAPVTASKGIRVSVITNRAEGDALLAPAAEVVQIVPLDVLLQQSVQPNTPPVEPLPEIPADAILPVVNEHELPPIQMREISTPPMGDSQPSIPTFVHVDCPRCGVHYRVNRMDLKHTNRLAQCRRCAVRFKINIDGTCTEEPVTFAGPPEDCINSTPSKPPASRHHPGHINGWALVGLAVVVVLMIGWMMGKTNQNPTTQATNDTTEDANTTVRPMVEPMTEAEVHPVTLPPTPEPTTPPPLTAQNPQEIWVPLNHQAVPLHPPTYYKVGAKPGKK